ncbi:hypothetical protein ONZ43_g5736 [Nemania bipapillata]|uniref:Uncharacterized protein n=1 Tax=Nemania bipapillata TaxID=110536 RepID=A0ACC2I702_9PEZI|nr:hypothetical protein ONZ43_g5736 [Nemania bipapillata]
MRRAVRDFGRNMVFEAKHEISAHLQPQDIDEIAAVIFEKCSDEFLDKALEKRLTTIDARSLINALARAERLGYENSDILDDRQAKTAPAAQMQSPGFVSANLIASTQSQPPPPTLGRGSLPSQTQPPQYGPPATDLQCRLCWRKFQTTKPYEYHVQKQLCMKTGTDAHKYQHWCDECGAGFTTKVGQQYPYSTPVRPHSTSIETPGSYQDNPYAHLTLQQKAELDEELRLAEASYGPRFREAEGMADPVARKAKLESLQNTFSTKQSIIRKKYGVRLRVRRTRAVIDEERSRMGLKHGLSSPGLTPEMPSAKRQRSDDANTTTDQDQPVYIARDPPAQPSVPPPANLLSVSEMNNEGLGGSTATAATTDPTASAVSVLSQPPPPSEQQPPSNSLSSLQRKGYRVSSHVGHAIQSTPAGPVTVPRSGSASTPVVLDESSDGSDTDEDIPATVPPKKAP